MRQDGKMRGGWLVFGPFVFSSLLMLSACQSPTTMRPEVTQAELMQEQAAQDAMVRQMQAQGGKPKSWKAMKGAQKRFEQVAERVEKSGADMCRKLGLQQHGCYFSFKMATRDDKINAYADGEQIIVSQGMMRFIESDEELALVLSHEMAHNLLRHPASTKNNALAGGVVGLLADVLAASQGVNTRSAFTKMGAQAGVLTYSRGFESEADYVGMYIMAGAGYEIDDVANLWRRFSLQDPEGIYAGKTHPTNPERFVALNKTVTEIDYKRQHRMPLVPEFKPQQ